VKGLAAVRFLHPTRFRRRSFPAVCFRLSRRCLVNHCHVFTQLFKSYHLDASLYGVRVCLFVFCVSVIQHHLPCVEDLSFLSSVHASDSVLTTSTAIPFRRVNIPQCRPNESTNLPSGGRIPRSDQLNDVSFHCCGAASRPSLLSLDMPRS